MRLLHTSIVYENPLPQLKSRQSLFPNLCELEDGTLLCCHVIGEAMESVDARNYISVSRDGGKTWEAPYRMFPEEYDIPESECFKITNLGNGHLVAFGYGFPRPNPELPLGNPITGGLLADRVVFAESFDGGKNWGEKKTVPDIWQGHTEASAPLTELADGALAAPITGFSTWEGNMTAPRCGRLMISRDGGKTWGDDVVCMKFADKNIACFEQRMCVLDSGTIVVIGWNENLETGERLPNHYTFSTDNGASFSAPVSTQIMGQAASVCALGGERFLVLAACRRDTNEPGIYGYVIDFSDREWNVEKTLLLWSAGGPIKRDVHAAEVFGFLKFGQPSAIVSGDDLLMTYWFQKDGQYSVGVNRIEMP